VLNSRIFFASFLILIGVLLLMNQAGLNVDFGYIWPIFLLIPGIFFWIMFYSKKEKQRMRSSLLLPGTILIIYSLYFFYNQITNYDFAGETSFVFTLGVALGFFAMYYFGEIKNKGILIPAWILAGVSAILLLSTVGGGIWWPIIIIFVGLFLLYKKDFFKDNSSKSKDDINND